MNKRGVCGLAAACMLALSVGSVSAQTVRPLVPEDYKSLVAGKTFTASLNGYGWGEDITDNLQMTWRISERETYAAETIESLQPGDELYAGNGRYTVGKIEQDEWGYVVTDEEGWTTLSFIKGEDGRYRATTENDNPFWTGVFTVEVQVSDSLRYLDWSDPEAEAPVELTVRELMERVSADEILLDENNTQITFDEEGRLSVVLQQYSPWN